jgi:DNA-binding transcriptional LysR family regulator
MVMRGSHRQQVGAVRETKTFHRPAWAPYSRLDVQLLEAVAFVNDLGGVARALKLRRIAVKHHLDRLDRAAGMSLTRRGLHTVQLTSAGARVLAAGQRFFYEVDRALQASIHGHSDSARRSPLVLAITTSNPVVEDMAEDVATDLSTLLAVSHATPEQVIWQLAAHRADAAHTWWLNDPRICIDRTVQLYAVLDDPLWVCLPHDHPLIGREVVTLADLTTDHWVSEIGPSSEVVVAQVFRRAGLPPPKNLTITSSSVARGMIRRDGVLGLGSPLSTASSNSTVLNRPLAERPSRSMGLLVDPTVVPDVVAKGLATMLRRHYLRVVTERHADILRNPWWQQWHQRQTGEKDPASNLSISRFQRKESLLPDIETLDVEDFRLLRVVAKCGSINRAAKMLSLSQPALSRRIYRIERRIGAQLLLRGPSGTTLSGPVRQFLRRLTELENNFHSAFPRASGHGA